MTQTLFTILKKSFYAGLFVVSFFTTTFLLLWISNINLFQHTIFDPQFSLFIKWKILGGVLSNFSLLTGGITLALILLISLNITALTFYFKNKISVFRASHATTGALGVFFGILGLGCAACGSFILMTILPLVGLGTILAILPLHGAELGILGVLLLFITLRRTLREIANPAVCSVY